MTRYHVRSAERVVQHLSHPEGPVDLSDGFLAFVEECSGRVLATNAETTKVLADLGGAPNGLALMGKHLYVAQNGGRVGEWRSPRPTAPGICTVEISTGAVDVLTTQSSDGALIAPNDLIVSDDGEVLFTDSGRGDGSAGGRICRLLAGVTTTIVETGNTFPNGIAWDVDGSLTWSETQTRRLVRLIDGQPAPFHQFAEGCLPDGYVVLPDGRFVVATTRSGGVHVLEPTANGSYADHLVVWETACTPTNVAVVDDALAVTDARGWPEPFDDGILWRLEIDSLADIG